MFCLNIFFKKRYCLENFLVKLCFFLVVQVAFELAKSIRSYWINPYIIKFFFLLENKLHGYFAYRLKKYDSTCNISQINNLVSTSFTFRLIKKNYTICIELAIFKCFYACLALNLDSIYDFQVLI
jgi:hypothetical protein